MAAGFHRTVSRRVAAGGLAAAVGLGAAPVGPHRIVSLNPCLDAQLVHIADRRQIAGLSRAHFTRQFTAALGQPPSDHTQSRRLERVERLLLATEMKVADIARATGFADPNYLAKVFRKHRGLSPLAFRATRAEAV